MELKRIRPLRGPNLWSRRTSLEVEVQCAPEECAVDSVTGFEERLRGLCPGISDLRAAAHHGS